MNKPFFPSSDYKKAHNFITPMEWPTIEPLVKEIKALKREKNAVILAHNYMTPDIFQLVGDICGDSLQLAREAANIDADIIVQAGVHFMAETSKILSPDKSVLIPDMKAGCSLASSITGDDIRLIRQKHPNLPVITYVNTSADVKAESDICCTSSNAVQVVEAICAEWGVNKAIVLPDEFLARNVATNTNIEIITWHGRCEVHEQFSANDIRQLRDAYDNITILAHPECPPDVLEAADFAGSTSALAHYVKVHRPAKVVLLTECSMSDNVSSDNPETDFIRPCNLCPHMKRITLNNIRDCLRNMTHEVLVDENIRIRAKKSIDAMLALSKPDIPLNFKVGCEPTQVTVI